MKQITFHPANERGFADHGWLKAAHSFSFAGFYDPKKIHFGALRVLNDDIIAGGMGFGTHPHDNMEIITIMLEGELAHKDSMGHVQSLLPNEVQVMSAGTGIYHSEYNNLPDKRINLLQTWIFPAKRNVTPRYDQKIFEPTERINNLQMLVSPIDTEDDGLKIHQNAWLYRATFDAGLQTTVKLHTSTNGFYIFNLEGDLEIEGHQLGRRDAIGVIGNEELTITSKTKSDFVVFEIPMQLR